MPKTQPQPVGSATRSITDSEQRFQRGVFYAFIRYAVSLISGLGLSLLFAHLLGSETLGTVALLTSILGIFKPLSSLGEHFALIPSLNRQPEQSPKAATVFWATVTVSLSLSALLCLPYALMSGAILTHLYQRPDLVAALWIYMAGTYLLGSLTYLLAAPFQAHQQMKYMALMELGNGIVKILILVVMVLWLGPTVMAAVWAYVLGFFINVVLLLWFLPHVLGKSLGPVSLTGLHQELSQIYRFSLKALPGNASISVLQHADRLILGYFAKPAMLGVYTIAYGLFEKLLMMGVTYEQMVFSSASRLSQPSDRAGLYPIYLSALRSACFFLFPLLTLLAGFGKTALGVFGPDFPAGATALVILLSGTLFDGFSRITLAMMAGLGRPGLKGLIMMAGSGLNLGLSLALIPYFQLNGAAMANTLGYVATSLLCLGWVIGQFHRDQTQIPTEMKGQEEKNIHILRQIAVVCCINGALILLIDAIKPAIETLGTPWNLVGTAVFGGGVLCLYYGLGRRFVLQR